MIIVYATSAPVLDSTNPDPHVPWAVVWVHADLSYYFSLLEAHRSQTAIPAMLATFPDSTVELRDVIVEEVGDAGSHYRLKFKNARRLK